MELIKDVREKFKLAGGRQLIIYPPGGPSKVVAWPAPAAAV